MFEDIKLQKDSSGQEMVPIFTIPDDDDTIDVNDIPTQIPLLALKNTVLFPGLVIPITIGRDRSVKAVKIADKTDKYIAVFSQNSVNEEDPGKDDLYQNGTVAKILKLIKMPDGSTTAILQGKLKCELKKIEQLDPFISAVIEPIVEDVPQESMEFEALISSLKDVSKKIIELSPKIPSEAIMMLENIKSNKFLIYFVASNLSLSVKEKMDILSMSDMVEKAKFVLKSIDEELKRLELKNEIEDKVRTDLNKQQKDYFLNQQLKTIQEELGHNPNSEELKLLEKRSKKMDWPAKVNKVFLRELNKAKRINPQMAEYSVVLTYIETLLDLPWNKKVKNSFVLKKVEKHLDKDHFGLKDVKKRILEHLAILKLKGDMKAPIICLVGPPGVGKTSLGKSIANALGREFVRMSLGGLHDESEIRGHRKTYIGAMPGRIIQSIKKVGTNNSVFILDEIDKIGNSHRGDPSSALLEVLDPEQNSSFYDNYLELEYDLSKILFIATANSLNTIQPALRDRMEIIHVSGYSIEEKIEIAKKHLIPQLRVEHGLKLKDVSFSRPVIGEMIEKYTRESGVRSLKRVIGSVMRNIAKAVVMKEKYSPKLKKSDLHRILGPTIFDRNMYSKVKVPGVAVGLAWTSVGGDILFIEASKNIGKGKLTLTGNLGNVMKESATTALSYIKANYKMLGIKSDVFDKYDLHIHVPQGAIPKDGPSAGITMLSALASILTGKKIRPYLAMTGEITLRGKVLPVGGIKEKILAAKRSNLKTIMLCESNRKHIEEIDPDYIKGLDFHYVEHMGDVLKFALNL